jgi:hypothetical protein
VNLNTDAEWRLSHDADAPHKEAWLTNNNTSYSRIFIEISSISVLIAAM